MKIGVVGAGSVGATIAYSVVSRGLASKLVLADQDERKAEGHAMDLRHCAAFIPPVEIFSGAVSTVRGMDVVVVATGVRHRPDEDPAAHMRRAVEATRAFAAPLARDNPAAVFIVVSEPVDLVTLSMIRHGGITPGQVLGTGTLLDTSRLRHMISARFGVDARNVHAFIIGQQGAAHAVPVWSRAVVSAMPLDEFTRQGGLAFGPEDKRQMFEQVTGAGQEIVQRKGATFYGIAEGVVRIITAIARDERSILTLSVDVAGFEGVWNLCLSLPVVVGRRGIVRTLAPQLSAEESDAFRAGVEPVRELARQLGI